jgi:CheY-like chemotaxis protein
MLLKPLLIYLADDDQDDRMLFKEALDEIDVAIAIEDFDNGVTLMDNLLNKNKPLPDLIYLDLNMPLMNGEECLHDIKNEPELSQIPIIIYSTYVDQAGAASLQLKGADLYLQKPDSFNKLKNLLRKSLDLIKNDSRNNRSFEFVISESQY